jgi:mevalonate kinase
VTISPSKNEDTTISHGEQSSKLNDKDGKFSAVKAVLRKALVDQTKTQRIDVKIESEIPPGSGLGSSAAVSVATAAAVLRYLGGNIENTSVADLANQGEASVHGNPSGVDVATSLNGGTILFDRNNGFTRIEAGAGVKFLVVFTDIERSTSDLVQRVSEVRQNYPSIFKSLTETMSFICKAGAQSIQNEDFPLLGSLMNLDQTSLAWIGVSSAKIESLIEKIYSAGPCYGAKLTGAGGGGSVIALPQTDSAEKIASEISKVHPYCFLTNVREEGLRFE